MIQRRCIDPDPPPRWLRLDTDLEPRRPRGDDAPARFIEAVPDPRQIEPWDAMSRVEEFRLGRERLARLMALKAEVAAGLVPPDQLHARIAVAMGWTRHLAPLT